MAWRRRAIAAWVVSFAGWCSAPAVFADAGWLESGDTILRMDLQLLNDAEVIRVPVSHWPIPRAAVQYALANAREHLATNRAVADALARTRASYASPERAWSFDTGVRGGRAGLWRDFDTLGRDDAELDAGVTFDAGRIALGARATVAVDPADGDEVRADNSHATAHLGNWLVSAHTLERWWGPGHEGSLILSNNARPMPTLTIERAEARPFENRWLRWLGPWRFSFGISEMESEREDIDRPLFMAWRVSVMPFKGMDIGFSRTAQFCGRQLECNLDVFGNLIAGNDNVGVDSSPESEPGNQMAGFDLRWNSPLGNLPYALYAQYIGEDESSYLPAKYIAQLGAEAWRPLKDGGIAQVYVEYTSTTCSANTDRGPYYNCAYNQGRFDREGYRYKDRVIGYTADRDAENYALGAKLHSANGELWTATARRSRLNRDDFGDTRNTVASVPTDYAAFEFGWKGRLFSQDVSVDLGVQAVEPEGGERAVDAFGFVGWRYRFEP